MKKTKDERRYGSFWTCTACQDLPEQEHKAMMAHLKDVHGIETKGIQAKRKVLMHYPLGLGCSESRPRN